MSGGNMGSGGGGSGEDGESGGRYGGRGGRSGSGGGGGGKEGGGGGNGEIDAAVGKSTTTKCLTAKLKRYMTRVASALDDMIFNETVSSPACSHANGRRVRRRRSEQHRRSSDTLRDGRGGAAAGAWRLLAEMGRRKSMSAAATSVASAAKRNLIHTHDPHTPWSSRITCTLASPKLHPHIIPTTDLRLPRAGRDGSSADKIR